MGSRFARLGFVLGVAAACAGCSADLGSQGSDVEEDTTRAPLVVRVPVRFTRNDVADVGWFFSSSWVPFTDVKRQEANGYSWAAYSPRKTEEIAAQIAPDMPGAGYATTWFLIEVPYDTSGELAYPLARVKLETEFIDTEIATTPLRRYSPMRVRRGSDQPCLSATAGGGLEGKLKAIALPYFDEGFTEREWKLGDKDASDAPIEKVIIGTLRFSAICWPENVEGQTHVAPGVAGGVGAVNGFLMVDQGSGQPNSEFVTVYLNLVENDRGEVSVGDTFSTSGTILRPRDVTAYNDAAEAFHDKFVGDANRYYDAYLAGMQYSGIPY
jgi:hypothetical protein